MQQALVSGWRKPKLLPFWCYLTTEQFSWASLARQRVFCPICTFRFGQFVTAYSHRWNHSIITSGVRLRKGFRMYSFYFWCVFLFISESLVPLWSVLMCFRMMVAGCGVHCYNSNGAQWWAVWLHVWQYQTLQYSIYQHTQLSQFWLQHLCLTITGSIS